MPAYIISFIVALFQLFHFGAHELVMRIPSGNTTFVATHYPSAIQAVSTHKILRGTFESEENTDPDQDANKTLRSTAVVYVNKIFFPAADKRAVYGSRAPGSAGNTPLFVLHCNFRI